MARSYSTINIQNIPGIFQTKTKTSILLQRIYVEGNNFYTFVSIDIALILP